MDEFLRATLAEAQKGQAAGGIPIGSVLVIDGTIVGRGHNQRVQKSSAVPKPSRVFQAVHFGVQHRAAFLHSLIVSATDDCAIDHEHRPDRNSTCSVSLLRFYECRS